MGKSRKKSKARMPRAWKPALILVREETAIAETKAHREWTKQNTTLISLRLNNNTDDDILKAIEGKARQAKIKRLIRIDLQQHFAND